MSKLSLRNPGIASSTLALDIGFFSAGSCCVSQQLGGHTTVCRLSINNLFYQSIDSWSVTKNIVKLNNAIWDTKLRQQVLTYQPADLHT